MKHLVHITRQLLFCLLAAGLLVPATAGRVNAQAVGGQDEQTLKALFIYNFTKQIEWPAQKMAGTKFIIAVVGKSTVSDRLNQLLSGRKIFDKTVEVRVVDGIDDALNAQIVFISKGQTEKLPAYLDKIAGKQALVITEEKHIASKGASINLYLKEDRLRFELNESNIRKEALKVSNQLLELSSSSK